LAGHIKTPRNLENSSKQRILLFALLTTHYFTLIFAIVLLVSPLHFKDDVSPVIAVFIGVFSFVGLLSWCAFFVTADPMLVKFLLRILAAAVVFWMLLGLSVPAVT
jgi:hypothetical protein